MLQLNLYLHINLRKVNIMNKIKIGCLTYKKLNFLVLNAIIKIEDPTVECILIEGLMEELTDKARKAIKDGVEIFVGGGANAEIIKNAVDVPVVTIKLTILDYIEAMMLASKYGNNVVIVKFESENKTENNQLINALQNIGEGFKVNFSYIYFETPEELKIKLQKLSTGSVVIGASLSNEISRELGIPSVLIYPGEEGIINSIKYAKEFIIALRIEREKSKFIEAILEFTPSGIIATDKNGNIITFNPAAEKIFGVNQIKAMGHHISKVMPQCHLNKVLKTAEPELGVIQQVNHNEIVTNRVPIEIDGEIIGAVAIVHAVSEIQQTEQKIRLLNMKRGFTSKSKFTNIIGTSKTLIEEIKKAKIYSKASSNVLIYGETGVGKEIFAQSIHNYSLRQNEPFVAINCAALPENLLESELFGYDEGAFTGSKKGGKTGLFEIAHGGTMLLDEIGELPISLQSRLLRVLQEQEIMRVGGDRIIPIDVRIIAATGRDLEGKNPGDFRSDLLYRLNVLQINIPPLRNRDDDVIRLFLFFLEKHFNISQYKAEIPIESLEILKLYSWPGNVRELQNVVERFALFFKEAVRFNEEVIRKIIVRSIQKDRFFNDILKQNGMETGQILSSDKIPKKLICTLEQIFPNQKEEIAKRLGVSRTTLWRLISKD